MIEQQINQVIRDLTFIRDEALPHEMVRYLSDLRNSLGLIEENVRALQTGKATYDVGSVIDHRPAQRPARVANRRGERRACPCECNRGGFCGGCGHAGCGGR